MSVDRLADAILRSRTGGPVSLIGTIRELRLQRFAGNVDWSSVVIRVQIDEAVVSCDWFESFNAVIQAKGSALQGRSVVVHIVDGQPFVASTIGRGA